MIDRTSKSSPLKNYSIDNNTISRLSLVSFMGTGQISSRYVIERVTGGSPWTWLSVIVSFLSFSFSLFLTVRGHDLFGTASTTSTSFELVYKVTIERSRWADVARVRIGRCESRRGCGDPLWQTSTRIPHQSLSIVVNCNVLLMKQYRSLMRRQRQRCAMTYNVSPRPVNCTRLLLFTAKRKCNDRIFGDPIVRGIACPTSLFCPRFDYVGRIWRWSSRSIVVDDEFRWCFSI